jgi:hypothetical protein
VFEGNREDGRPLRKHRRGWEDNIKIYVIEIGLGIVGWFHLAQDRK